MRKPGRKEAEHDDARTQLDAADEADFRPSRVSTGPSRSTRCTVKSSPRGWAAAALDALPPYHRGCPDARGRGYVVRRDGAGHERLQGDIASRLPCPAEAATGAGRLLRRGARESAEDD
jgi:hypothetical protein